MASWQNKNKLKLEGRCKEDTFYLVKKIYRGAFHPRLSATKNLARLLSGLDEEFHYPVSSKSLRWNVMEDAKALYLVRDMYDCTGTVPVDEYTAYQCNSGPSRVFGCVRVYEWMDLIRIVVGKEGPTPVVKYGGFLIDIELPEDIFIHDCQKRPMNVKNEALKIAIPKHENKWIHTITTRGNIFEELKMYKCLFKYIFYNKMNY
uniref:uncharacterized protein LOC122588928 isoform X2 n=1 Tax=Erigeron canadensis TaxID=72917 RepID=UPI001CB911FC|nr:uncharacterized protein LOC122588928 isoform X2 [Erigeron canadensis]